MKTFKDEWQEYRDNVVPLAAGSIQYEETQKAFYSGGIALFVLLTNAIADRDVGRIDALRNEFGNFGNMVEASLIIDAAERSVREGAR